MLAHDSMLTTIDNPFDPFDDFDNWYNFDKEKGYDSCERLSRIANFSNDMSEEEIDQENERAIDKIIEIDFLNVYKKSIKKREDI